MFFKTSPGVGPDIQSSPHSTRFTDLFFWLPLRPACPLYTVFGLCPRPYNKSAGACRTSGVYRRGWVIWSVG